MKNAILQSVSALQSSEPLKGFQPNDISRMLLFRGFDQRSITVFLRYLTKRSKCDDFMRMYAVFGRELLLFLSLFHSETVKIPALSVLNRIKQYSQIYAYLEARGFTEDAYRDCGKLYGRRRGCLEGIVSKVQRAMEDTRAA